MAKLARTPFIRLVTLAYGLLALGWVYFSDHLLTLIADREAILRISSWKGGLFVLVTTGLLYVALRAVPPATLSSSTALLDQLPGEAPPAHRRWLAYPFAVIVVLVALWLHHNLMGAADDRPLMILFALPIALSALLGGLLPGLLATLLAALGMAQINLAPLDSLAIDSPAERLQLYLFVLTGGVLSAIIEMLKRTRERLDFNRHLLDAIVAGTPDAIFVKDRRGRYVMANQATAEFVGVPRESLLGKTDGELFPAESAELIARCDTAVLEARQLSNHDEQLENMHGRQMVFSVSKGPLHDPSGAIAGLFGIARDITERKRIELARQEAAAVFEASYEGIMVLDEQRRIVRVNPAFARITGYSPAEALGQPPLWLESGELHAETTVTPWLALQAQGFWSGEVWSRRKDGERYAQLLSLSAVRDGNGAVQHYVGLLADITPLKNHQAELEQAYHYDPLTGLPNRRLLGDRLEQAIARCARSSQSLAVCQLDLDDFRQINKQYGHATGDALLRAVASNLREVLRAGDTLARLGGDEFALLLADIDSPEDCSAILARIQTAIATPVLLAGTRLSTSASIGVSLYPDDNVDGDTLLRHADQAMFLAKESGKACYHLFDPDSDRQAQHHRRQLERLRQALERDEFVLHYQPKVDLGDGRVVGAEALIRWQDPERGLIPPGAFLPYVESVESLERALGEWVLEHALAQLDQWNRDGLPLGVSVNIGASQLTHPDFVDTLDRLLQRYPELPRARLELEILETAAIADMERAVLAMQRCAALGVRFALDDFGTGYSSLTYLRKLPVDTLKIDQSFVRDMLVDPDDRAIVDGVIRLASAFNRQVIAEGVETIEHGQALQRLGCRLVQGYGIARPMPAEQLPAWLRDWQARGAWRRLAV